MIALKQVFSKKRYATLALFIAVAVIMLSAWLPNLRLIKIVFSSSTATLSSKFNVLFNLLGSIQTNFTGYSIFFTITIAVLFGINVAMVIYFIKQRKKILQQSGLATSFGGLVTGLFGVGCATCGTIILGPVLSAIGLGGLITFLPFNGQEFTILSIILLALSIFWVARKIQEPSVCKVPTK